MKHRNDALVKLGLLALILAAMSAGTRHGYFADLLVLSCVFGILAMSLDLIVGYVGELSLGHAAFFGIGAYTSTLLVKSGTTGFVGGVLAAAVVPALVGLVVGAISLRLRGPYFALATLAFGEGLSIIAKNWESLTGGPMGINGVPKPVFAIGSFSYAVETPMAAYILGAVILFLVFACLQYVLRTHTGQIFVAIRENSDLCESLSIPVFPYKLLAFTLSALFAGVAGSLYAHYTGFISSEVMDLRYLVTPLIMVLLGGRGTLFGPLLGAVVFTALPELLRMAGSARMVTVGFSLTIILILLPNGLAGIFQQLRQLRATQPAEAMETGRRGQ